MSNVYSLRSDALAIWQAGVDAVQSDQLVRANVSLTPDRLDIGGASFAIGELGRIVVVGAGKAGAGMAAGLETALGDEFMRRTELRGWINVPADCSGALERITLHAARPAGVNEPREEGVQGTSKILELVSGLGPADLCICLLSGGGSALLPAPVVGLTLADKQMVTRFLSGAGANIQQLNTVRKQLSRIKGGGLKQACRAGRLVTMVISDVLGDPLDVIASGPTVENTTTAQDALNVLEQFQARKGGVPDRVFEVLSDRAAHEGDQPRSSCVSVNQVIGNNAAAVSACKLEAERRGYSARAASATELEGAAETIGRDLADKALALRGAGSPACWISGGEPTVTLVAESIRGRGGRNQQLVLAALDRLLEHHDDDLNGLVLLSGGTDGEDGPTDAAGAVIDADSIKRFRSAGLDLQDHLLRNDAYHFFAPIDGLIQTGPTHTNVCDVRVVVSSAQPAID